MILAPALMLLALQTPPTETPPTATVPSASPRADAAREGPPAPFFVIGSGVVLAAVSGTAFTYGLDVERTLTTERHTRAQADALLSQRNAAAWIAWPTAVAAGAAVVGGATWAVLDAGGAE